MKTAGFDAQALASLGLCTGCGLCAAVSGGDIAMVFNRQGFLRPAPGPRPLPPAQAARLATACPAMALDGPEASTDSPRHPLWGPVRQCLAGHAVDEAVRLAGSSGGVLTALALHLLASGQVQAVAQITVDGADPLSNRLQLSTTREQVLAAAGSRYAPTAPLATLLAELKRLPASARVAFIGKPCDVAALRQWQRHDTVLAARVPWLLSFFCAGVPSQKASERLLDALQAPREQVVAFRYRGDGWPGQARASLADGSQRSMDYQRSWGGILGRDLQQRCKICPDGTGEFADVVAADAWYGEGGYPDFAERPGRSLVLSRTGTGQALLAHAAAANALELSPLDVGEIERMQPYQATRKRMLLARWLGLRLRLGTAPRYRRLGLWRAARQAAPLDWLRQAWGSWRRTRPES